MTTTLPTTTDLGDVLVEMVNDLMASTPGLVSTSGLELLDIDEDTAVETYGTRIADNLCAEIEAWTPESAADAGFRPWAHIARTGWSMLPVAPTGGIAYGALDRWFR